MKDTKYEDLNKTLAAVGKAVFVNFYYDFKDSSISKDELAKKILLENPGSKSELDIYLSWDRRRKHYVLS